MIKQIFTAISDSNSKSTSISIWILSFFDFIHIGVGAWVDLVDTSLINIASTEVNHSNGVCIIRNTLLWVFAISFIHMNAGDNVILAMAIGPKFTSPIIAIGINTRRFHA